LGVLVVGWGLFQVVRRGPGGDRGRATGRRCVRASLKRVRRAGGVEGGRDGSVAGSPRRVVWFAESGSRGQDWWSAQGRLVPVCQFVPWPVEENPPWVRGRVGPDLGFVHRAVVAEGSMIAEDREQGVFVVEQSRACGSSVNRCVVTPAVGWVRGWLVFLSRGSSRWVFGPVGVCGLCVGVVVGDPFGAAPA